MNLNKPLRSVMRVLHSIFLQCRLRLPRQQCPAFSGGTGAQPRKIESIFVINLDRQPSRWAGTARELDHVLDVAARPLSDRAVRFSACDAQSNTPSLLVATDVDPFYTLGDQLFVEPQPLVAPDVFDLERPIRMTRAEIAVAQSHINVWRKIAQSSATYTLVLEDDVWFEYSLGRILKQAWIEMVDADRTNPQFDIFYLSYKEVRHGAPKELVSENVFRPERGLWYMSGYVLSKKGAQALLDLLPCRGPVDLWINLKFRDLDVRALRRSVIHQRKDLHSTNAYSILPTLSRIGILDNGGASLFHLQPVHSPVFAFGAPGAGLSSLAMALSMLGYRCCSDFDDIPAIERSSLLAGREDRVFNAYVNIKSLWPEIQILTQHYPAAKFIVVSDVMTSSVDQMAMAQALRGADALHLTPHNTSTWQSLCEYLRAAPPDAPYPIIKDIGLRRLRREPFAEVARTSARWLRYDPSPWIAKLAPGWNGIGTGTFDAKSPSHSWQTCFEDDFAQILHDRWLLRNDTFPGNLGLFRPANVVAKKAGGISLAVFTEVLGVRNLSAAAISSRATFLFGRFEAALQATNVPGLVTGFFLHRDSPRQEIDVEILGNQPDKLLVNVFYNPGIDGTKFDYGYRGAPAIIELGFDASKASHRFAIEWDPNEIRWFVDQRLVHRRAIWGPTPIPHLPMTLHLNTWPSRSRELAGRLALHALPASATIRHVAVAACSVAEPARPKLEIDLTEPQ